MEARLVKRLGNNFAKHRKDRSALLYLGDCERLLPELPDNSVDLTLTSPPYFIGKEYDSSSDVTKFVELHQRVLSEIVRITRNGGSICWQVGYHVQAQTVLPLDYLVFDIMRKFPDVKLRNRIVWTFGHGTHCKHRFSGRHEVILWFSKGSAHKFNLDAVRVPQRYPGKRHYKGPRKGEWSGNPLGKNPGDVWELPNVRANHVEKTKHPCQFPISLAQRLIRGICAQDGLVFDPFAGVATTGVAALIEGRRFIGAELRPDYCAIALERLNAAAVGSLKMRALEKPVVQPDPNSKVAQRPPHFAVAAE